MPLRLGSVRWTTSAAAWAVAVPSAKAPQKIAMARVSPNAGQMGLFIADADGSNERQLVPPGTIDYDPVWAKCLELGVVPTFHSSALGVPPRVVAGVCHRRNACRSRAPEFRRKH